MKKIVSSLLKLIVVLILILKIFFHLQIENG